MKLIHSFDPSTATSGTFDPQTANACGRIYLFNESAIGLQLSFSDGSVQTLPPYYVRSYKVARPGLVTWTMLYSVQGSASPLSLVVGESYESAEAAEKTFTEGPLNRQTNIANTVNTAGGTVASIQNDGNPAGTVFIESTVAGDTASAVKVTTDAQVTLGDTAHNANVTVTGNEVISGNLTVNSQAFFAAMEVFGQLYMVAQTILMDNGQSMMWKDNGGTVRQVLVLSNTNKVIISGAAQFVEFRNQSGTVIMSLDLTNSIVQFPQGGFSLTGPSNAVVLTSSIVNSYLNGSNSANLQVGGTTVLGTLFNTILCNQRVALAGAGGWTSVSTFTGTGTTTNAAHGCKDASGANATPDFINISCTQATSTMTTGYAALTSTTCTITCGSAFTWKATAYKF